MDLAYQQEETYDIASVGLKKAAKICYYLVGVCGLISAIGAVIWLYNHGDVDSYGSAQIAAVENCTIGVSMFVDGLCGAFACFVLEKILKGLYVISFAAEKYFEKL
ncbi:MAG: hypothetical protein LIO91_11780 [Bacteroidales bacterium]|nr:hypothetical protein [Bacteroidales bacterium]